MTLHNRFHVADVVVFGATIVISLAIGIYYALSGGKQKTTSEFLLGGRLISFLPVAISLLVSFESSIMMLGTPAEAYVYGVQFVIACVGYTISHLSSVYIVVPLLHPLRITSAYEYLEYRFQSKAVRLLGTAIGMLTYCCYMGVVLFGPAVALEAVTGFPQWVSIFAISVVAVIYTSIGGLKAVVWTDVFQACIMFLGIFAVLVKGTLEVGGPKKVWDVAYEGGRLNFFQFDLDPKIRHTFFNLFFTSIIRGFGMCFNQSTVQRISSTKTVAEARKVILIVAPFHNIALCLCLYEGIVAYAYYATIRCDPFESQQLTNSNQIMPLFVMDIFKHLPGMPGLFLAALFSACLSTLSSGLSSLSALFWADIAHPLLGDISETKATIIAKVSVLCFGAMACGLAYMVSLIGGTLIQISGSLLSAFSGPVTGLFLLAAFSARATATGAFVGGLVSLAFSSWLSFAISFSSSVRKTPWLPANPTDQCPADLMGNFTTMDSNFTTSSSILMKTTSAAMEMAPEEELSGVVALYNMSYTFIGPLGILATLILGYVTSLVTGPNKPGDVDPRYLLNCSDFFLMPFPRRLRNWVSSFGPQFLKEEYKALFPDPAQKDRAFPKEVTVDPSKGAEMEDLLPTAHPTEKDRLGRVEGDPTGSVPNIVISATEKDSGSIQPDSTNVNTRNGSANH